MERRSRIPVKDRKERGMCDAPPLPYPMRPHDDAEVYSGVMANAATLSASELEHLVFVHLEQFRTSEVRKLAERARLFEAVINRELVTRRCESPAQTTLKGY